MDCGGAGKAEISTAKILKNGEVKMKIPKSDKVTLGRLSI
jgi:ribosome-associated protein YbcJ (S4-like RNA binding protein)